MSNTTKENSGGAARFEHYIRLILRRAWFIFPVCILCMIGWIFTLSRAGLLKPPLEATVLLRFDDPANLSAVDERVGDDPESRLVMVKSRSLLEDVVAKLSLQLQTGKVARASVFDSITLQNEALLHGNYEVKIAKEEYLILFTNKSAGVKRKEILRGNLKEFEWLELPGINVRMSEEYRKSPFAFKFTVCRSRDAIDNILSTLSIRLSEPGGTIMTITLSGKDYALITQTVNAIADDFVESSSSTKGNRKKEILAILEKQLKTAERSLRESEAALKNFRDENPTVGLPDATLPPNMLNDLRESEADLRSHLLQANALAERYKNVSTANNSASLLSIVNEMIAFLMRHNAATASALHAEFNRLSQEQRMYDSSYSPAHPLVTQNKKKIQELGEKVSGALSTQSSDINRRIRENENRINSLHRDLAALPQKEIRYSKLKRDYEVNSEVYASVLSRYNEALVANSVSSGDVYLVDKAVEPESGKDLRSLFLTFGAGLLFSLCAGFGPVILADSFDRRARTVKELSTLTNFLLLESIPIKGKWKERTLWNNLKEKTDPKLVSADYSHNFVDETYRSLRAKILLSLFEEKRKRIIVTSLNMGEGKSFTASNMAITMAQQNLRTVLIDADMRRGVQHTAFGTLRRPGLSNLLSERSQNFTQQTLEKALCPTHINNLSLLPCGTAALNSAELINSNRFRDLLEMLSDRFDMVIMDTPPLAVTTDAAVVMDCFQRYIVVVRANFTNITHLNKKIAEFPGLKRKVLGLVFNGAPYQRPEYYQYNSYKY